MKLVDAQARVLEAALNEFGGDIDRELVARVARLSIEAIGFHIAADGEICDPRPKKDKGWAPPSPANWRHKPSR